MKRLGYHVWGLSLLISCGSDHEGDVSGRGELLPTDQIVAQEVLGAEASLLSAGDIQAVEALFELPSRWNDAAALFVRGYLDPNVPSDRWTASATAHVEELRAIYLEMNVAVLALSDDGLKATFETMTGNYKAKLDSVTDLHFAVAQNNPELEQEAKKSLSTATEEGNRLANALLDKLRPFVESGDLSREILRRGQQAGVRMRRGEETGG